MVVGSIPAVLAPVLSVAYGVVATAPCHIGGCTSDVVCGYRTSDVNDNDTMTMAAPSAPHSPALPQ